MHIFKHLQNYIGYTFAMLVSHFLGFFKSSQKGQNNAFYIHKVTLDA